MLARHSTITLTMDRYAHMGIVDLASELRRLPALGNGHGPRVTGTDGAG
jgi:hypothetical protein